MASSPLAFRFVFEVAVRAGEEERFIQHWKNCSKHIQEYPGARGTRLHKKHGVGSTYVAIAEWDSKESRVAAMDDIRKGESERAKRIQACGNNEDYGDVTVLADLDEIARVLPFGS